MKVRVLLAGVAVILALTAGGFYLRSEIAGETTKNSSVVDPLINTETLKKRLSHGEDIDIVDVREPEEFAAGHIPGARNLPLGALPHRLKEVSREREVVLVCRSDNRSGVALQILQSAGFSNARNLVGGMLEWGGEVTRP